MRCVAAPSCDFQAAHPDSPLPACLYELAVLCPAFDAIGRYAHAQRQSLQRVLVALHGAAKAEGARVGTLVSSNPSEDRTHVCVRGSTGPHSDSRRRSGLLADLGSRGGYIVYARLG